MKVTRKNYFTEGQDIWSWSWFFFKIRLNDQEVGPAGQTQSGARAGKRFLILFRKIEQDQEKKEKKFSVILDNFKNCNQPFTYFFYYDNEGLLIGVNAQKNSYH